MTADFIKKHRNGTWAMGGLFQTLSEKIWQLFSSITSLARWGCFVEFWTRLTSPIFTLLLVSFFGFQENAFSHFQKVLKRVIQNVKLAFNLPAVWMDLYCVNCTLVDRQRWARRKAIWLNPTTTTVECAAFPSCWMSHATIKLIDHMVLATQHQGSESGKSAWSIRTESHCNALMRLSLVQPVTVSIITWWVYVAYAQLWFVVNRRFKFADESNCRCVCPMISLSHVRRVSHVCASRSLGWLSHRWHPHVNKLKHSPQTEKGVIVFIKSILIRNPKTNVNTLMKLFSLLMCDKIIHPMIACNVNDTNLRNLKNSGPGIFETTQGSCQSCSPSGPFFPPFFSPLYAQESRC